MRRPGAVVLAAVVALAASGCGGGGSDRREPVEAYLRQAAAVQARWAKSFERANQHYADFAAGRLKGQAAARETAQVRDEVGAARADFAAVRPPAEARTLHDRMLHVFDLNLALATETAQLAAYVPAEQEVLERLPAANRHLRRRLASAAGHPGAQASALNAFKTTLDRTVRDLRGLTPPPVLRISHSDHIHALARTARLSGRLRSALRARDAQRTARLLDQLDRAPADRRALARDAVEDYGRRVREVSTAMQQARQAEVALNRRFASS